MIKIFPTIQIKRTGCLYDRERACYFHRPDGTRLAGIGENNIRTLEYGNSFHSICRTRKQWRRCPCCFASAGAAGVSCRSISFNTKGSLSPDCETNKKRLTELSGIDFHEITTVRSTGADGKACRA